MMKFDYQRIFIDDLKDRYNLHGKRILEIGGYDGTIAEAFESINNNIVSIDTNPCSQKVIKMDAEQLLFDDKSFDMVISVATFEHINKPEVALEEAYRVLKDDGDLVLRFSPIWTAINGHHYRINDYTECPIPPWGHLYMDRNKMLEYLESHGVADSRMIIEEVYCSNYINRVNYSDYRRIFREDNHIHTLKLIMHPNIKNEFLKLDENIRNQLGSNIMINGIIYYGKKRKRYE